MSKKSETTDFERTIHAVGDTTYLHAVLAGLDAQTAKELAVSAMWQEGIKMESEALKFKENKKPRR